MSDQGPICAICQDDETRDQLVIPGECGHIFHQECLETWLSLRNRTCPHCRAKVTGPPIRLFSTEPLVTTFKLQDGLEMDTLREEIRDHKETIVILKYELSYFVKETHRLRELNKHLKSQVNQALEDVEYSQKLFKRTLENLDTANKVLRAIFERKAAIPDAKTGSEELKASTSSGEPETSKRSGERRKRKLDQTSVSNTEGLNSPDNVGNVVWKRLRSRQIFKQDLTE